jgi:hypothetical protein
MTARKMKPHQRCTQLLALPHLLTQLPRTGIGPFHFWDPIPLGESHGFAECELEDKLSLGPLHSIRQHLEQLYSRGDMTDHFCIGRPLHRLLPG